MRKFAAVVAIFSGILAVINFSLGDIGWGFAMMFCALLNADTAFNE